MLESHRRLNFQREVEFQATTVGDNYGETGSKIFGGGLGEDKNNIKRSTGQTDSRAG